MGNGYRGGSIMRTQPQDVIKKLEADNSRLAKEQVIEEAMQEGLDEFFQGVSLDLLKLLQSNSCFFS